MKDASGFQTQEQLYVVSQKPHRLPLAGPPVLAATKYNCVLCPDTLAAAVTLAANPDLAFVGAASVPAAPASFTPDLHSLKEFLIWRT